MPIAAHKPRLSVILITLNPGPLLAVCLGSLKDLKADEIIILDSGSTDNTQAIAASFQAKFFQTDWPGFGVQKQRALAKATGDWVLSLDADEILTPAACQEIRATLISESYAVYRINRVMVFAGQCLNHGGASDRPIRLFKRGSAHFNDKIVHESLITDLPIGSLKAPVLHYSYKDIGDWVTKTNRYTDLEYQRRKPQLKGSISRAYLAAVIAFLKMYIGKKGFLDGRLGLVHATQAAIASYFKYLKIALNNQFDKNNSNKTH
jgi:glycosyltransferase involved in cell wall biosynthesis